MFGGEVQVARNFLVRLATGNQAGHHVPWGQGIPAFCLVERFATSSGEPEGRSAAAYVRNDAERA